MAAYRFYGPADAAQDKIWRDTVDTWGDDQAETYIRGLHAHLQRHSHISVCGRKRPLTMTVREMDGVCGGPFYFSEGGWLRIGFAGINR